MVAVARTRPPVVDGDLQKPCQPVLISVPAGNGAVLCARPDHHHPGTRRWPTILSPKVLSCSPRQPSPPNPSESSSRISCEGERDENADTYSILSRHFPQSAGVGGCLYPLSWASRGLFVPRHPDLAWRGSAPFQQRYSVFSGSEAPFRAVS